MGYFEVVDVMEQRRAAPPIRARRWRLWPLAPILLLALVVGAFVSAGTSIVDLIGRNPPAADMFDIGRIEFRPGEIRIRVRNPQPEELTIASVTVDDAIVPFTLDGPATLKRLRSSTIVVPYDWVEDEPTRGRRHELDGDRDGRRGRGGDRDAVRVGPRVLRLRADRLPRRASCRSRSACSGCRPCAAPTRSGWRRSWRSRAACSRSSPSSRSRRRSRSRRCFPARSAGRASCSSGSPSARSG